MNNICKILVTVSLMFSSVFPSSNIIKSLIPENVDENISQVFIPDNNSVNLQDNNNKKVENEIKLVPTVSPDECSCYIELSGLSISSGKVQFAIWCDMYGQDDLRWYDTTYDNGIYSFNLPISNHGQYGNYNVHAYTVLNDNYKEFITLSCFEIKKPTLASLEVSTNELSSGKFNVQYNNLESASGIKSLSFAIWSDNYWQDDLKWYEKKYGPSSKVVTDSFDVDLYDHFNDLGLYNIHVYITTYNGINTFLKDYKFNIMFNFDAIGIDVSNDQSIVDISLGGCEIPDSYSVLFPVWSAARNQQDIRWWPTSKENNFFKASIHISDYAVSGLYHVHAYLQNNNNGQRYFISLNTFNIDFATFESINVSKVNVAAGTFSVTINNIICPAGLDNDSVTLFIWSDVNWQDDLHNYFCTISKLSDGVYSASYEVPLSNHYYTLGKYNIHVYIRTNNNIYGYVGQSVSNVDIEKGSLTAGITDDEKDLYVNLDGSSFSTDVDIEIAVWSDINWQDDLQWYHLDYVSQGSYSCRVPISNHHSLGLYHIHCYYKIGSSEKTFLNLTTVTYSTKASANLSVPQDSIDGHNGTFKIIVSDVNVPSGVEKLLLPTWGDDVSSASAVWHEGTKINESTYEYLVNVSDHRVYFGGYTVHLYIDMGNGIRVYFTAKNIVIQPSEFSGVGYLGNGVFRAVAYNYPSYNIASCSFPTWSIEKEDEQESQDDLIWHAGTVVDAHNGYCDINMTCHRPEGKHRTDVYFYDALGTKTYISSVRYWVTEEQFGPEVPLLHGIRNGIDVSQWQGWIDWPTVAASWQVGFAMVRIGYGWSEANGQPDTYWEQNYYNSRASGFPIGGYWYSYAQNPSQAAQEAYTCLACLNGRYMDLPIAYDLEQNPWIDPDTNTAMINTFCSIIASAGYKPMVYASESWYNGAFNVWGLYDNITYWVAQWTHAPIIPRSNMMRIWQTSASGYVSGISGEVDTDYIYY